MRHRIFTFALASLAATLGAPAAFAQTADDLTVLQPAQGEAAPSEMVYTYLKNLTHEALDRRTATYEALKTNDEITAYQKRLHDFFVEQLGGFPERTPLNARVVDTKAFADYRIEKVIYESRPKFYVTAILYLPLTNPPYPAVLVPCGHSPQGKAYPEYQRVPILLARNGIAALCYDPVDQGERSMIVDENGQSPFGSVKGHTMMGVSSILLGINTASYRVWDGMRSLDYLASRPEIDPERLGCTGNSGGGTLTSYIMALDPRVQCAAPSCYITSLRRLVDTAGPQDAEQNIHGQIAFGMDQTDYILMRATKPTLICCATKDFFDIQGTWDTFRQAKRLYTRMGFAERVSLAEVDAEHGYHLPLREAMARWMRRWLLKVDDAVVEPPDFPVLTDEELWCAPKGQVLLMEGAKSVYDFNAELEEQLAAKRKAFWSDTARENALQKVREIAGIRKAVELPDAQCEKTGDVQREGYRIEKLVLRTEPGIVLPALAFVPAQPDENAYLYCHGDGKQAEIAPGGAIETLVKQGHIVLAVDVRGIGETAKPKPKPEEWNQPFGAHWQEFFLAYMLDKSFVGMRAEDILVSAKFLANYQTSGTPRAVHLVAVGEAGPPALHAAALEPGVIATLRLERSLSAWSLVARGKETENQLINAVHGALRVYDLPDLLATLPQDKVTVVAPTDERGRQ